MKIKLIGLAVLVATDVSAAPYISEVMYNLSGADEGREWIEIINASPSPICLTNWFIYERNVQHGITAFLGGETVPIGGVAVIAGNATNFLADNPLFSGMLFDSSFSLLNSSNTIVLRNPNREDIDSMTYSSVDGANGDGNSLQKIGSVFSPAAPTPGIHAFRNPLIINFSFGMWSNAPAGIIVLDIGEEFSQDQIHLERSSDFSDWIQIPSQFSSPNTLIFSEDCSSAMRFFRIVTN